MFQIVGDDILFDGEKVGLLLRNVHSTLRGRVEESLDEVRPQAEPGELSKRWDDLDGAYRLGFRDGIRACRRMGVDENAAQRISSDKVDSALREEFTD